MNQKNCFRTFCERAVLTLLMMLLTPTAWAETIETFYLDEDGTRHNVTATVLTGGEATNLAAGWYVVNSNISYTGTVTLTGNVNLILADGCTMNVGTSETRINGRGIDYNNNATMTVFGQSVGSGILSVYPTTSDDAISVKAIIVNGGGIIANTNGMASIGIYAYQDVTINGGTVTITADGISSRGINANQDVTINGGTVTITADGSSSKGIIASNGSVTINGGTVTITADGSSSRGINVSNGSVTINGGKVNATATGTYATGINADGTITLAGGVVTGSSYSSSVTVAQGLTYTDGTLSTYTGDITPEGGKTYQPEWEGTGTSETPYQIKTTADLDLLAKRVNAGLADYNNVYFQLANDITYTHTTDWNDASSTENNYTPIGGYFNSTTYGFSGHFDGANHTVSGIRLYKSGNGRTDCFQGLFGSIRSTGYNTAEVKNVILADARITGYHYCGGIVGYNTTGTVSNCRVLSDVTIHAVQNGATYHGGIVGNNSGAVIGCTSAASITIASDMIGCKYYGGIVGDNRSEVYNCLYLGNTVEGNSYVGAIIGYNNRGTVNTCYFTSTTFTGKDNDGYDLANDASAVGYSNNGSLQGVGLGHTITLGDGITIAGDQFTYNVSGLTFYNASVALSFNDGTSTTIYSCEGDFIQLSHTTRAGYEFSYVSSEVTVDNDNCFQMPDEDVTITASWTPSTNITLTANAHDGNYWTTFYCGEAGYKIDEEEDTHAYTAEYDGENSQLTLHKLGKVIPQGTAVIIVAEDNSISMTTSTEDAEFTVENDLHGVDVRTEISTLGTGTFYVMGKQNGNFGFFQYAGDYMPARKAYLLISGAQVKGLKMVIDEATGIASMSDVRSKMSDVWYGINGMKLSGKPATKGLYIHNGTKEVIQ